MADTAKTNAARAAAEAPPRRAAELAPGRPVDLRRALQVGLLGGLAIAFVSAVGMTESFETRKIIGDLSFSHALLVMIVMGSGYLAGRPPPQLEGFAPTPPGPRNVVGGLAGGVGAWAVIAVFLALVGNFDVRDIFTHISPRMVELLSFNQGLAIGSALVLVATVGLGGLGGALHLVDRAWRRPFVAALGWLVVFGLLESLVRQIFRGSRVSALDDLLYLPAGALSIPGAVIVGGVFFALYAAMGRRRTSLRESFQQLPKQQRTRVGAALLLVTVGVLVVLPTVLGQFLTNVMNTAGIFLLMALGLNIVVGLAGLLDLGYVAFFAVGAYTMAVLSSPISPAFAPELTFAVALPFVLMAAALSGILIGTPVLRMRGDYLAIVTLGFGEIARLMFLADATKGTFGGARGVRQVPDISLGFTALRGPQRFYYAVIVFIGIAAYIAYTLQKSRLGRAWMAMREDESVAEAMGVNTVAAKLWAFIIGAILGSFGGALFAVQVRAVFPHSFEVIVSITVLVIIIVGGLASMPGVAVGALALIAAPQILREFEEFRFLIYGALLIFMMVKRPEGFIPSRRRARELHEDELAQDDWLKAEQERQEAEAGPVMEGG